MRDRPSDTAHRRAAARALGRSLTPDDLVHHTNEDKADQTFAHLAVTTRSAHTTAHNRARPLSRLRAALRMVREKRRLY